MKVARELGEIVPEGATIITIKELIEKNKTFKSEPDFVTDLICSTIQDRKIHEQNENNKLVIERIRLTRVKKELELATIRTYSAESQTNLRNYSIPNKTSVRSVRTLSMPDPSRPENYNLFFNSLERAFITKAVPQELK